MKPLLDIYINLWFKEWWFHGKINDDWRKRKRAWWRYKKKLKLFFFREITFSNSAWCSVTTPNGGTSDPPKTVWSPISLVAWIDSINRGNTVTEPVVCPPVVVEVVGGAASGCSALLLFGLGLRPWLCSSTSLGTSSSIRNF